MSSPPLARPVYLGTAPDPVFGFMHPARAQAPLATAVLLLPPFGYDETASYRSRAQIATELAAAGHPVLRIDLPGTGDSAGTPRDPGRLDAWVGAAGSAAAWLRSETGSARVAAFGIGLGGLVAYLAAERDGAVDDLILWGAPARGRALVRELRAFARLTTGDQPDPRPESRPALPDGLLHVSGFVISPETNSALSEVDLAARPIPGAESRRVLLLGRDGVGVDDELRLSAEASGADVTVAPGDGFGAMTTHPQESRPPEGLSQRVADWLAGSPGQARTPMAAAPVAELDSLELTVPGGRIRERFVEVEQPFGRIVGVVAEPAGTGGAPADLGLVLVNSGSIRRIGPNRMWVEVARRWAARGVPTLRLDVEGVGDAGGEWTPYADTADLYRRGLEDQVMAAIDDLVERGVARRFAVVGLCSGAFWAFHALRRHDRISAGLLLNLFLFYWNPDRSEMQKLPRPGRLLSPSLWWRVIRGRANPHRARAFLRWAIGSPAKVWGRMARRRADVGRTEAALTRLREQGKRAVLFVSPGEPLWGHLRRDGLLDRIDEWPNVELRTLEPVDHTFRALWMQQEAHQALDSAIAEELARSRAGRLGDAIPGSPPDVAASADRPT